MSNEFFEKSKIFFESGDISNTLESYEKSIAYIDPKYKSSYIQFLNQILKYCREKQLEEEEAIALRSLGRTHSIFKQYVESLRYHEESLRIQRKLGNKNEVAEGLLFLAEDLEISGNYEHCLKAFEDSTEIFHELGKPRKAKEIQKEVDRLRSFSEEMVKEESILKKFHMDNF